MKGYEDDYVGTQKTIHSSCFNHFNDFRVTPFNTTIIWG